MDGDIAVQQRVSTISRPAARSLGRPYLQLEAEIPSPQPMLVMADARRRVLEWLQRKSGVNFPASAWSGDSFITPATGSPRRRCCAMAASYVWRCG